MTADRAIKLARSVDALRSQYRIVEAEATARTALWEFPQSVDVLIALGRVLLAAGRAVEALAVFSRAEGEAPGNDLVIAWQIAAQSRQLAYEDAITMGKNALRKFPGSVLIRVALGRTYLDSSRPLDALAPLAEAVKIAPADEMAISWYAACHAALYGWAEAEKVVRDAITRDINAAELHYRLGRILLDEHRYAEALACFEVTLKHRPGHAHALEWRITALRGLCRFNDAEDCAKDAVEHLPGSALLHTECAWVACDQGKYDQALTRVGQALSIEHDNRWALCTRIEILRKARRFTDAEQAATEAMEVRGDDPRVFTAAAWVSCDQGRYDQALARVGQALDIEHDNCWALCTRIEILREVHRFTEAEQAVDKALQVRPGDPDIYVSAAWVCSDQDYEVEAADRVVKALEVDHRHPEALAARVYFLRWARRFEEAKLAADKALELRPGDPDILAAAGWVCSDRDQHMEALGYIDQALKIDPCSSWILNCRINFLRAASRYDEAEKFAQQVQRDRPDDPDMQVAAGWLYGDRDQYLAALACFDRALEVNPWHLEALVWRTVVHRSLLRFGEAAAAAADAIERRPCDLAVRIELGRIYDTQLDFGAALTHFVEVLDLEPENVEALIARSAAFRSLRRYDEAEREITRACLSKPGNRDLLTELGWIRYDQGAADGARDIFQKLFDTAENDRERAAACYGLGWACFAAGDFSSAAKQFREAKKDWPEDSNYRLGLAWSLGRQEDKKFWSEAEDIAHEIASRRPDPFAHACLGVIAFRRGSHASAEYYLKKALELDPFHASHTDLGALYTHTARYAEAEVELQKAVIRDWHDKAAHMELGCLFLQWADGHLPEARDEFRRALAIDPASAGAAIGLARVLVQEGDDAQAESVLRASLDQQVRSKPWQTYLALAQLLVREGNKQQNPDLHREAYEHAQQAINQAPDCKTVEAAEPYFVAGLAQFCLASLTTEPVRRNFYQQRAKHHMKDCLAHDKHHIGARRYLQALEREMKVTRPTLWGGFILGTVSFGLLLSMWIVYFVTTKVGTTVLAVNTPVLAGLFTISALLPTLIRLKMPGFEADLQPPPAHEAPGPTGEDTFGPGRFTVTAGPTGQIPRRDQSRHHFGKSTKHR